MDEPSGSESTGMGPTPSGPSFVPWAPTPGQTPPIRPFATPTRNSESPATRAVRRANLISVGVILFVAIVVMTASLVAHLADTHISAPAASKKPRRVIGSSSPPPKEAAS
jgi:hypothetical protein